MGLGRETPETFSLSSAFASLDKGGGIITNNMKKTLTCVDLVSQIHGSYILGTSFSLLSALPWAHFSRKGPRVWWPPPFVSQQCAGRWCSRQWTKQP